VKVTCTAILIYINIAAHKNKEVAIASGNYERTREQKEASTLYEYSNTQKNKVPVKEQRSPRNSSTTNRKKNEGSVQVDVR
jgi:hypothetical protein